MRIRITLTRGDTSHTLARTAATGHEARRIVREARTLLNTTHGRWRASLALENA